MEQLLDLAAPASFTAKDRIFLIINFLGLFSVGSWVIAFYVAELYLLACMSLFLVTTSSCSAIWVRLDWPRTWNLPYHLHFLSAVLTVFGFCLLSGGWASHSYHVLILCVYEATLVLGVWGGVAWSLVVLGGTAMLFLDFFPLPNFLSPALAKWMPAFSLLHNVIMILVITTTYSDALEEVSRIKTRTLAALSHELRTPLQVTQSGLDHLMDVIKTGKSVTEHDVAELQLCAAGMSRHLTNIMSMVKAEKSKRLEEAYDLQVDLLERLKSASAGFVHPDSPFVTRIEPGVPRHVKGDVGRVSEVLLNFLSNAVKASPPGSPLEVVVALNKHHAPRVCAHTSWLCFSVLDAGCGVDIEDRPGLFDAFVQGKQASQRGGVGLGLYICTQLAESMHGRVGMEPRASGGSDFWLTVPLIVAAEAAPVDEDDTEDVLSGTSGLSVLVVDDNALILKTTSRMLTREFSIVADVAADGVEALQMAKSNRYDVVLMDLNMPRLDGVDCAKRMRKELWYSPFIAAVTGSDEETAKPKCDDAMDHFVSKPYTSKELRELFALVDREK